MTTNLQLYPFQRAGVRFLRAAESALLADEMGTGKTIQTIVHLELANLYPALIVCPNTVKANWAREFGIWAEDKRVVVAGAGTAAATKAAAKVEDGEADVLIINWDALRSMSRLAGYGSEKLRGCENCDPIMKKQAEIWEAQEPGERPKVRPGSPSRCERCAKVLNVIEWQAVVADEAHRAKSPKAKQTRALWAVGQNGHRRIALTGSPVANSPEDLWSIMRFVAPDEWPVKSKWLDRYCVLVFNPFANSMDVVGLREDRREELDKYLLPRMIRRTKAQVLPDLPPKTYERRDVALGTQQRKAYDALNRDLIAKVDGGHLAVTSILTLSLRLRQLASAYGEIITEPAEMQFDDIGKELDALDSAVLLSEPSSKLDALEEVLEELGGAQVVVFAESRQLIDMAYARISERYNCGMLTGPIGTDEREVAITNFREGRSQVMLATTGAGGEGVDGLQAASVAVFLQRPWSSVVNKQAEDRLHRIGQDAENVLYIDLVAIDTIEDRVFEALIVKGERLEDVVQDKEALRKWLE